MKAFRMVLENDPVLDELQKRVKTKSKP